MLAKTRVPTSSRALLEFLVSNDPLAQTVLERVTFQLVPMMNPDGFEMGGSRYNGALEDLNSEWTMTASISRTIRSNPKVLGLKNWIDAQYQAGRRLSMMVDVHNYGQRQFRHTMQAPDNRLKPFCEEYLSKYWTAFVKDKHKAGHGQMVRLSHLWNPRGYARTYPVAARRWPLPDDRRLQASRRRFRQGDRRLFRVMSRTPSNWGRRTI